MSLCHLVPSADSPSFEAPSELISSGMLDSTRMLVSEMVEHLTARDTRVATMRMVRTEELRHNGRAT